MKPVNPHMIKMQIEKRITRWKHMFVRLNDTKAQCPRASIRHLE